MRSPVRPLIEANNSLIVTEFAGRHDVHPLPRAVHKRHHLGRGMDTPHFQWTRRDLKEMWKIHARTHAFVVMQKAASTAFSGWPACGC